MDDNLIAAVGTVSMFNAVLFLKLRCLFNITILKSFSCTEDFEDLDEFLVSRIDFSSQISFLFSSFFSGSGFLSPLAPLHLDTNVFPSLEKWGRGCMQTEHSWFKISLTS